MSKSGKHKNRVRTNRRSYSEAFSGHGSYAGSMQNGGTFDKLSGENLGDGQMPWSQRPISDVEYDKVDALYSLYDSLKGRQKQILKLMLEGETNQISIAKALNMKQSNVNVEIKKIRKKAEKISYS